MTFLTPWSALVAAAVALPLLVLLYMLKLRRQPVRLPSTLLWRKAFEDLHANTPFQKLRWSWLLALQLLLMLALLAALAQPLLRANAGLASRVIVLVDCSASMNAMLGGAKRADGKPRTRLDAAKDAAVSLIDSLGDRGAGGGGGRMMVITFGASAQVVSNYQSSASLLRASIQSIQPTDDAADLDAALQLAGAFAGSSGGGEETDEAPPEVVLISDGNVGSGLDSSGSGGHSLTAGQFKFVQVVPAAGASDTGANDNVGIAAFSVRRDADDPMRVLVFARLVNAGSQAVSLVATLEADGRAVTAIRKTIAAATEKGTGEEVLTHAMELPGGAVFSLRQNHADRLAADDVAWAVLPAPTRPRIALVHPASDPGPGDSFVHDLLEATDPQQLRAMSFEEWNSLESQGLDPVAMFDLVVFDRISPAKMPAVPTLTIGGVPGPLGVIESASQPASRAASGSGSGGARMLSWDRQHPIMRNVSLDDLVFAGFDGYVLPDAATPLAFGPRGPVMAMFRERGVRHVAVGFELRKSNWSLLVSITVFMQNLLDDLSASAGGREGISHHPGEAVAVRAGANVREVNITGPVQAKVAAEPGATVTLPVIHRAGLYSIEGAAAPNERMAFNVAGDVESDIRPRDSVTVNAQAAAARKPADASMRPLWPWLVAAAIALLVLEWIVYCSRSRGG